ncbi:MAG: hypothetical protein KF847_20135 [Pirellulales bacterium]|nr:hypothetical protein [Pirellulales bacterium]
MFNMNSRPARTFAVCGIALSTWLIAAHARAAFLEGEVMKAVLLHITEDGGPEHVLDSGDFVVGPEVELQGFGERDVPPLPALVDIDISDSQILMTLLIDQPFAFQEYFLIQDSNDTIVPIKRAEINPATNWAGFEPIRLGVLNGNVVTINVSQLLGLQGQQILIDLTPLPEPAAGGLALMGLASGWAVRRRVRRARRTAR